MYSEHLPTREESRRSGKMTTKFSDEAISRALQIAREHGQKMSENAVKASTGTQAQLSNTGHLQVTAECITVSVRGGQVCIDLPLGIGHVCLPIPLPLPDGTKVQACLAFCTHIVPTGIEVSVSYNGNVLVRQSFGWC